MGNKHIIIYTFQSLEDPLLKGLMLEYLLRLNQDGENTVYHVISHEQDHFKLGAEEKKQKSEYLNSKNIFWYPVNYKNGEPLLLKKLINFLETFFICVRLKIKYKPEAILGFLAIAGGYSYILSRLLFMKLIVFCYEPHSEYMVDFGLWKRNSLRYKILRKFERLQLKYSDHIVVPTVHSLTQANALNKKGKTYLTPICIDTSVFKFSAEKRVEIRNTIKAKDKRVIIYTGKFGGIYYDSDEIIALFNSLIGYNDSYFLYIITPNVKEVKESISKSKIPSHSYFISDVVPYENLQEHISAADIGLVAVPPFPSQKFRTPVKTAIYLSCGVPYIINKGIAEDDVMAKKENVGVVIEDLKTTKPEDLHKLINDLLSEDKATLSKRCTETAYTYRDIHLSLAVLKQILHDLFSDRSF